MSKTLSVIEIKNLLKTSITQLEIAKIYNINPSQISRIKAGTAWKEVV